MKKILCLAGIHNTYWSMTIHKSGYICHWCDCIWTDNDLPLDQRIKIFIRAFTKLIR